MAMSFLLCDVAAHDLLGAEVFEPVGHAGVDRVDDAEFGGRVGADDERRVDFDAVDTIGEEKKLLDVVRLLFALVKELDGCRQALSAFFHTDLLIDWKKHHDENLTVLC